MLSKQKTMEALETMYGMFPEAHGELKHNNPFELLIAVILSAQATDVSVNKATPDLFASFPTPDALAEASIDEIILKIKTIGLYRNKAKNIKACAQQLIERFDGQVPTSREELMSLPGVGRKTANVVLGDAFGIPAIASRYPRGTCLKTPEDLQTRCYGHGSRRNTDAESTTRIMGKDTSYTDFFW